MRLARDIQLNLLPTLPPRIEGYDIAGKSISAKDVGGDYFDYIPRQDNTLAFCLGDVSGKGMPAALLMANLQATLRGQSGLHNTCHDCIQFSNKLLYESTDPQKFATLFYGILDPEKHQLRYCNAGHDNPVLIRKDETPVRLETGGVVMGFVPDFHYSEDTTVFDSGTVLLIYSDGITEAMNQQEEEFGEERLFSVLQTHIDQPAQNIIQYILDAVSLYVGKVPQMDDMTLLVIKRNP
jgi:sigma-B regulation protein RsbU (phosphoserine phosphatase)